VVISLPTMNEADSLRWVEENRHIVDWGKAAG
jgi:hypothetical protein